MLEIYIKLLELVIQKTTPNEERYKYSRYKRYFEIVYPKKSTEDEQANVSSDNPQTADMDGSQGININGMLRLIGNRQMTASASNRSTQNL